MTDDQAMLEQLFAGGGEMGALMRSLDWSQTLLGPVSEWAQTQQPDVILLDLTLDGDGLTLLQTLKTNPTTQSIPAILFTALDPSDDSLEFDPSDFAGVILNPFNVLQLADRIY